MKPPPSRAHPREVYSCGELRAVPCRLYLWREVRHINNLRLGSGVRITSPTTEQNSCKGSRELSIALGNPQDPPRPAPSCHRKADTYSKAAASAATSPACILPRAAIQLDPSLTPFPVWIHRRLRAGTGDWLPG